MIGMIQPDELRPSTPNGAALYRVGCLGRLSSFSETDDGRYLVTLTGVIRFSVAVELEMQRGYRRVRGDLSRFKVDLEPLQPGPPLDREGLLAALRAYFTSRGFDANWDVINDMQDDALIVHPRHGLPVRPGGEAGADGGAGPGGTGRDPANPVADGRPRAGRHAPRKAGQLMSDIDPRLLEILVCPVTKGPLEYDRAAHELISRQANLAFPIRDGIPVMLPDEARVLPD